MFKYLPSGLNWILVPVSWASRLIISPPLPMIIPTLALGTTTSPFAVGPPCKQIRFSPFNSQSKASNLGPEFLI